jgi:hypothetical protein
MNAYGLGAPLPTVTSKVEISNSCNCCCFPWRKKKVKENLEIVRVAQQALKK